MLEIVPSNRFRKDLKLLLLLSRTGTHSDLF
jgi:mRNA-degrading endonuclease YafQ of YafQ-DinJ toxin-antitoxin module